MPREIKKEIRMEQEDQRLVWKIWLKSYRDHRLDFIDWLHFMGYEIRSVLIDEDAENQKEETEIAKLLFEKNVQPIRQNKEGIRINNE